MAWKGRISSSSGKKMQPPMIGDSPFKEESCCCCCRRRRSESTKLLHNQLFGMNPQHISPYLNRNQSFKNLNVDLLFYMHAFAQSKILFGQSLPFELHNLCHCATSCQGCQMPNPFIILRFNTFMSNFRKLCTAVVLHFDQLHKVEKNSS